ncbi:MAG TPA: hydroxymethylglutaryl-CoA reductase (NADPH) [Methanomassiliicoccales archaeon]|nr:hydroxymethylglutaryl-CoA reductase (NADPH) [Methanomassiliicoccales archaeon]
MVGGLKNRGRTRGDVKERREAVEKFTDTKLEYISSYTFDPLLAEKNIENMIGCVQVPVGFVGPILINGEHAQGEFLVPMATTEGALLASVNRGCSIITSSGGSTTIVVRDAMTRAPVFRVNGIKHGVEVANWVKKNFDLVKGAAESTTRHGKLVEVRPFMAGRNLYLRFAYETGDAMGMNMATIATEEASMLIERETGATLVSISGNLCVDKKPAGINSILGRGKSVHAEVNIPRSIVEEKLHTSPEAVAEACVRKNALGSSLALSYGFNANMANIIAATFIATGQDAAQVVEGSMGTTTAESVDGALYFSVRIPALEVGTVGGGTRLPCQSEALSMMGCLGEGKAKKLAEIIASAVLAGELSTLSAEAAGHLSSAHSELGR